MGQNIFLVDREAATSSLLGEGLRADGFQVFALNRGADVFAQATVKMPGLIVVNADLPDISGFEVCRQLQGNPFTRRIPLIIVAAQAKEEDRIRGFELGADDFVTKPFGTRELILRIKKSLDRTQFAPEPATQQKLSLGALSLDTFRHEVTLDEAIIHLTPIEFRILELLMRHLGGALSRKAIHQEVWPDLKYSDSRTMDAHLKRLREKLGPMGRAVETLTGFGYRLNESLVPASRPVDPRQMQLNELVFAINRVHGKNRDLPGLKKKLNALLALK